MTHGIREQFTYARRVEKGVQTSGRDAAEPAGQLPGFCGADDGRRQVAGYRGAVCQRLHFHAERFRGPSMVGVRGGATHAWMQAYLPGAGWIDFDPTNSIIGNRNLIRVAVAWAPEQVLPLWGTYEGPPGSSGWTSP